MAIGEPTDWFSVSGQVEIAGEPVNLKELIEALKRNRAYVQLPSGKWAKITEVFRERIRSFYEILEQDGEELFISPGQVEELSLQEEQENVSLQDASRSWWGLKKRSERTKILDENTPRSFKAELRPYQKEGFRWLHRLSVWGMGACLADDMGLGKTIQTLAVLQKHSNKGPSLVIAPVSVASNWKKECEKFSPDLQAEIYRGSERQKLLNELMPGDIVIASYGLVWRGIEVLQKVS